MEEVKMADKSDIQNFYRDKKIFLTGGSGFLGKVFIEKLLRSTNVGCVYLLIRPKRGKTVSERINAIFKDPLFEKLNQQLKDPASHLVPIVGDCSMPNLGISDEDRALLIAEVDIVVHSAATVRFNEPMNNAVAINVQATLDLIQMARQMAHLKAFVHVSSAFANCVEKHIAEEYYTNRIALNSQQVCQVADILGPELLNRITNELIQDFPNSYTYTKALAEEAVLTHAKDLPICIFRPSIVIPTYMEPVSGWVDNLYGPTSILYGVAFGVLRVMYGRIKTRAVLVPVDFCANMMIALGWNTAKSVKQFSDTPPPIFNLVPEEENGLIWDEYRRAVLKARQIMPLSQMIWYPFLLFTTSKTHYHILCFFYHTIPGYLFDFLLFLMGKKRRLVKTYRKIHQQAGLLDYFVEHDWTFTTDNTQQLWKSLSDEDRALYRFDMKDIDWPQYFYKSVAGMRRFLAKEDPSTIPKGKKLCKRFLFLHRLLQCLICGGIVLLVSWLLSSVVGLF